MKSKGSLIGCILCSISSCVAVVIGAAAFWLLRVAGLNVTQAVAVIIVGMCLIALGTTFLVTRSTKGRSN